MQCIQVHSSIKAVAMPFWLTPVGESRRPGPPAYPLFLFLKLKASLKSAALQVKI